MGIDIDTYAGVGIHIPMDSAFMKEFEGDLWDAYEALHPRVWDIGQGDLTLVSAQDTWSGVEKGLIVYVHRLLSHSEGEFLFSRLSITDLTVEESRKLGRIAQIVGVPMEFSVITVVNVT